METQIQKSRVDWASEGFIVQRRGQGSVRRYKQERKHSPNKELKEIIRLVREKTPGWQEMSQT
jgi:hypothetical protein